MKSIFCTFILLNCLSASSQNKGSISGAVKDSTNKFLQSISVSVTKGESPDAIYTTKSDSGGHFAIPGLDAGAYKLSFSATGFQNLKIDVRLADGQQLNTVTVTMFEKTSAMKDVVIKTNVPPIQQTNDKIIYNTEADPASKTMSVLDLLRRTPFVSVDANDNILVNGQNNFRVFLNGRQTAMFASNPQDALRGLSGNSIARIEVITNPSAKYDAEGVGGIINIVTKAGLVGYNGSASLAYQTNKITRGSSNFSGKFGKLAVTFNYSFGSTNHQQVFVYDETTSPDNPIYKSRVMNGYIYRKFFFNTGNTEVNYTIDSLNVITAYGSVSGGNYRLDSYQDISTILSNGSNKQNNFNDVTKNETPTRNFGVDYVRKFKHQPGKELSFHFYDEYNVSNNFDNSITTFQTSQYFIDNETYGSNRQYTLQADYATPLKHNQTLETGIKTIIRRANSNFSSYSTTDLQSGYKLDPSNTDDFSYQQNVYSAYASYNFKLKKYDIRLGLRMENTAIDGSFFTTHTQLSQNYTCWLPNVQISTRLNNVHTLVLSYNMRLQRPFISLLNPFVNNNDSLKISFGNPYLQPQKTHTVILQDRIVKGGMFLGLSLTASYSNSLIAQYVSFDKTTGITSTTSANIGKQVQILFTPNINVNISQKFSINANGFASYSYYYYGKNVGQKIDGFGGNLNLFATYKFSQLFSFSPNIFMLQSSPTLQGYGNLNARFGFVAAQKLFNQKVTLNVFVNNLIKEYIDWSTTLTGPDFQTKHIISVPVRLVGASLTWNFGKLKENVSKKKGVTNDDLL